MTHPRKGMTLGACSLGDSEREGEKGTQGLTGSPETPPSTYFCTWHGDEQGEDREGECITRPPYVRGRQRTEIECCALLGLHNQPWYYY